jgi:hypothetical protein
VRAIVPSRRQASDGAAGSMRRSLARRLPQVAPRIVCQRGDDSERLQGLTPVRDDSTRGRGRVSSPEVWARFAPRQLRRNGEREVLGLHGESLYVKV